VKPAASLLPMLPVPMMATVLSKIVIAVDLSWCGFAINLNVQVIP
jgi:hypothetical protein